MFVSALLAFDFVRLENLTLDLRLKEAKRFSQIRQITVLNATRWTIKHNLTLLWFKMEIFGLES